MSRQGKIGVIYLLSFAVILIPVAFSWYQSSKSWWTAWVVSFPLVWWYLIWIAYKIGQGSAPTQGPDSVKPPRTPYPALTFPHLDYYLNRARSNKVTSPSNKAEASFNKLSKVNFLAYCTTSDDEEVIVKLSAQDTVLTLVNFARSKQADRIILSIHRAETLEAVLFPNQASTKHAPKLTPEDEEND